jgi:pyrroline-5-carboxylate reductase
MEKIGFIGYGAMGGMIIRGILSSGVLTESDIIITTRTLGKLEELQKLYPGVEIAPDNSTVAQKSGKIFLFVNTGEVKGVLEEIDDHIVIDTHIIYIAAGLTMENLEKSFQGKISKVIPTLTSEVNEGISLVAHNSLVGDEDAHFVERIFKGIGAVRIVEEGQFGLGANITSSAPAFIALIMRKYAEAAQIKGSFTPKEVDQMLIKTLYGTGKLLQEKNMDFGDVIGRVATKGGITEEGLEVLDEGLTPLFHELFEKTMGKYEIIEKELNHE